MILRPNNNHHPNHLPVVPSIGTQPLNFDDDVVNYSHPQILEMMVFYNETFNIVAGDNLKERIEKFVFYLKTY
jgi:hypothetical protein